MSERMAWLQLVTTLVEQLQEARDKTPEEGGWVRTTNTAFRAASTPEAPPKVPEAEQRPTNGPGKGNWGPITDEHRQKLSDAGKSCSRCGREGMNVRTCIEVPGALTGRQRHRTQWFNRNWVTIDGSSFRG